MTKKLIALGFVALTALGACGETTAEQGLIGAGAGAALAAATDNNIAAGAIIGAGANVLACSETDLNC